MPRARRLPSNSEILWYTCYMESDVKQHFEALNEKLDRVIDAMATKEELHALDEKVNRVIDAMVTHEDLHEELRKLEERIDQKMDKRFSEVMTAIDRLAKVVADLTVEYAAIKMQNERYERWFKQLANHAGIKLES